jgi:hypothetical protein
MKDGLPAIGRHWLGVEAKRSAFAPGPSQPEQPGLQLGGQQMGQ